MVVSFHYFCAWWILPVNCTQGNEAWKVWIRCHLNFHCLSIFVCRLLICVSQFSIYLVCDQDFNYWYQLTYYQMTNTWFAILLLPHFCHDVNPSDPWFWLWWLKPRQPFIWNLFINWSINFYALHVDSKRKIVSWPK